MMEFAHASFDARMQFAVSRKAQNVQDLLEPVHQVPGN
jgi:hypothetical protein